jgi:hypothetical protein
MRSGRARPGSMPASGSWKRSARIKGVDRCDGRHSRDLGALAVSMPARAALSGGVSPGPAGSGQPGRGSSATGLRGSGGDTPDRDERCEHALWRASDRSPCHPGAIDQGDDAFLAWLQAHATPEEIAALVRMVNAAWDPSALEPGDAGILEWLGGIACRSNHGP